MKNLKKYFKMLVTAVICFLMGAGTGKKKIEKQIALLTDGQAFGNKNEGKEKGASCGTSSAARGCTMKNAVYDWYNRCEYHLRKNFFWLQGPGDRAGGLPALVIHAPAGGAG